MAGVLACLAVPTASSAQPTPPTAPRDPSLRGTHACACAWLLGSGQGLLISWSRFSQLITSPSTSECDLCRPSLTGNSLVYQVNQFEIWHVMKKLWKCKTCRQSFQSKERLDNHWLSCWEKNQGKKFFNMLNINSKTSNPHKTPIYKFSTEKNKLAVVNTDYRNRNNQPPKNSPKIKTASVQANCSCKGENERCFKCSGTGFYERRIVTNVEQCKDRIQEKQSRNMNSTQESTFSNDQRGGIYGI